MSTSEIAKLESRWRENPQGLTFAPLAEAYRKQKDPRRALEILQPGLERHPDYIPANIVLGRCHWDLSDLEAAEQAFTHVLTLDGENVIALKALADITERQSRPHEAERWLEMLLSVDHSNDEARDQLARIRAVQSLSPIVETPSALAESSPEPTVLADAPVMDEPEPAAPAGWVSAADDLAGRGAPAAFAELSEPADATGPPPAEPEPMAPAEPAALPLHEGDSFRFERAEEIVLNVASGSEFQSPSAAEDLMSGARGARGAVEPEPQPGPEAEPQASSLELEPPPPAALFGSYPPYDAPAADEPPAYVPPAYIPPSAEPMTAGEPPSDTDAPATAEPDLVVTETMAQVFLRQGHVVEALAVYRELAARSPESERLRERVAELEARYLALSTPPPRPSFLARDTGGQSLGSFFSALLAARPERISPASGDGAGGMELSPETAPAT
ncbi:MAG: tetratricopeptide repeat protein, partial [Gemmatimonadales bacterium]